MAMRGFASNQERHAQHRGHLANLLLVAVLLFPNWASAHDTTPFPFTPDVIMEDPVPLLEDHEQQLKDELLPIVHECPQVSVTIRAQDMTQEKLTKACIVLKETEDHFHATMQTDPAHPIWTGELEILAFSDPNDMNEYWKVVYSGGRDAWFSGVYLFQRHDWTTAVVLLSGGYGLWAHEYVHHLDWTFNQPCYGLDGPVEGLAGYIVDRDFSAAISVIGDGSNLPGLLEAWKYWEQDDRSTFEIWMGLCDSPLSLRRASKSDIGSVRHHPYDRLSGSSHLSEFGILR